MPKSLAKIMRPLTQYPLLIPILLLGSFLLWQQFNSELNLVSYTNNGQDNIFTIAEVPESLPIVEDTCEIDQATENLEQRRVFELNENLEASPMGLRSCQTNLQDQVGQPAPNSENVYTTLQYEMPMWGWLNSSNLHGTGDTPLKPPLVRYAQEITEINGEAFNAGSKFNILAELKTQSGTVEIPIPAQGLATAMQTLNDFTSSSTSPDLEQLFAQNNPFILPIDGNDQCIIDNINTFGLDATSSTSRLARLSIDNYQTVEATICQGASKISQLYVGEGDGFRSPEYVISNDDFQVEQVDMPLLLQALSAAYRAERNPVDNVALYAEDSRIIHRNNLGIEMEITKRTYRNTNATGNARATAADTEDGDLAPIQNIGSEAINQLNAYEYSVYFPWVGQIREIYKRINLVNAWNARTNEIRPQVIQENFEGIISDIASLRNIASNPGGRVPGGQIDPGGDSLSESRPPTNVREASSNIASKLESLEREMFSELALLDCDVLDSYSRQLQEDVIDPLEDFDQSDVISKAQDIRSRIEITDCVDYSGEREDPLHTFLCERGALEEFECLGIEQTDQANTVDTVDEILQCKEFEQEITEKKDIAVAEYFVSPFGDEPAKISQCQGDEGVVNYCELYGASYANSLRQAEMCNYHKGLDIVSAGDPTVQAIADGEVVAVVPGEFGYGNYILIRHESPSQKIFYTRYAHLASFENTMLRNGSGFISQEAKSIVPIASYPNLSTSALPIPIKAGDPIGVMGNTGASTGAHLDLEIILCNDKFSKDCYVSPNAILEDAGATYPFGACSNDARLTQLLGTNAGSPPEAPPDEATDEQAESQCTEDKVAPKQPGELIQQVATDPNAEIDLEGLIERIRNFPNESVTDTTRNNFIEYVQNPRYLEIANTSLRVGSNPGTTTANDIFPTEELPSNIHGLIFKISQTPGFSIPPEKVAAHLHVENLGINAFETDVGNKLNGYIDQTRNFSPNGLGCLGPGQFCPGTIEGYFHPSGSRYEAVRQCAISIGFDIEDGEVINPSYAGTALCAKILKLTVDTEAGFTDNWNQGCCHQDYGYSINSIDDPEIEQFIPEFSSSCRNYAAARRYAGGCSNQGGIRYDLYCYATADTCGTSQNSLLVKYKQIYDEVK